MQSRSRESEQENKLTDVCANPVEFLRQNRVSDMLELMRGSEPIRHSDDSFNGFYVTDEIDEEHWEGWLEFRTRSGKFEEREIKLEDTILSNNAVTFAFELSEESWSKGTPIIKTGKTKARNDGFFFKSQAYPNAFFIQPDVGVVLQLYWCESEGGFAGTIHGIYYMRSLALAGYPYVGEIHLSREAKK
jgi:hypothetical protein